MRLERLTLERYGSLENRTLNFRPDAALHVVFGGNEAGKTTTLSAIGDLLFGFPLRTPYGFAHKLELLRLGGALRLSNGDLYAMRRRKGKDNTVVDANDKPMPDDALRAALAGVTRPMFESEFGLTAAALRAGGRSLLEAGGRLAETLAAGSAGLSALSRLRERIVEEAEALFTPRKSAGKPFYVALDRYEQADRRLREAIVTADALKSADDAIRLATAHRLALVAEHEENGAALQRLQRAARTRPKLGRLRDIAEEARAFAGLPALSSVTLAQWRAAFDDDAALTQRLDALAHEDAADRAGIEGLAVDGPLLAAGETIDVLRERLGAARKATEDLPNRLAARNAARDFLDDAARRLGLLDHAALLAALPSDAALARAQALIASGRIAADRHRERGEKRDRAVGDRDRLAAAAQSEALDPEPLRRRLEAVGEVGADADRLRRDHAANAAEARALAEAALALDPRAGDPASLASLPLPDSAAIAAHANRVDALATHRGEANGRIANEDRAIREIEAKRRKLALDGIAATRADLAAARSRRDDAFGALADALAHEPAAAAGRLTALAESSRAVDRIADALLADAERAARLETLDEQGRESSARRKQAELEVDALEAQGAAQSSQWAALWVASCVAPLAPAEMARWRERVAAILARREAALARGGEIDALAAKVEARRAALVGLLRDFGVTPDGDAPADLLHREAQGLLGDLQRKWSESRARQEARARADREAAEAIAALQDAETLVSAHREAWPAAAAAIGLPPAASLEEAEAALAVWRQVAGPRQTLVSEQHRIDRIREDLAAFDADVGAAVAAARAPAPSGLEAPAALKNLTDALADARKAAGARGRLEGKIEERIEAQTALEARREGARGALAEAASILGVAQPASLGEALEQLERRQALDRERVDLLRDLAEVADGFDEQRLRVEQEGLDVDAAPAQIERLDLRQKALLDEIGGASARQGQAKSERDALARGRDAVGAARERAEAGAELMVLAERWLARAAAAELARRAIERRREAAQDPLIDRAGALFALATAQNFLGLGAEYDQSDQPILVAVRSNGSSVKVDELSEGARDQLFLALRLALLERRAGEPLPFIGDDLLASFDDARTACTLSLLAEFGRGRQAIVFTHHRHVADLAAAAGNPAIEVLTI